MSTRALLFAIAVLVTSPAATAGAAPGTTDPSLVISVEWMNTSGDTSSSVPWMMDLTVALTTSEGDDLGDRCEHLVWADQQPSFLGVAFNCFDLPDGEYSAELVGVPVDEAPINQCRSVRVPSSASDDNPGPDCLISFFSAGVTSDYPPTGDVTPATTVVADIGVELPATGGPSSRLLLMSALLCTAGLLLRAVRRRRDEDLAH